VREASLGEVTDAACRRLLAQHHLGRLAWSTPGWVVFRTDPGTKLDAAADTAPVAFEVDAVDEATRTGWGVVVRGALVEVSDPDDLERLRTLPLYPGPQASMPAIYACSRP
jgi:hypothetical protein